MLKRVGGYMMPHSDSQAPDAARQLERRGYAVLRGVFDASQIAELADEAQQVYDQFPADQRNRNLAPDMAEDFRYEMCNRSAAAQRAIASPDILATIEPLLGEDCHVIANTCWRNPARDSHDHAGGFWHIDAGPHVPRDEGIPWDDRIPYPIFAIGAHLYIEPCDAGSGPTGVLPGSHRSGRPPPRDRVKDSDLTYEGEQPVALTAAAGDVALFVSDVWHRRLPASSGNNGRFFLQAHYGRRDIAQRLKLSSDCHQLSEEALLWAQDERRQRLLGLHPPFFYDG